MRAANTMAYAARKSCTGILENRLLTSRGVTISGSYDDSGHSKG